jgi:hypothetical protein
LRVRLSLRRIKVEYAIGVGIGILFVLLGVYALFHFFTVKHVIELSFAETSLGALFWIFLGIVVLRLTIPAFIPLKKNNLPGTRACPYCGAIVDEDANLCKKCNDPLD